MAKLFKNKLLKEKKEPLQSLLLNWGQYAPMILSTHSPKYL